MRDEAAIQAGPAEPALVHVVDDDAAVRRSLSRLLQVNGLMARAYPSGEALLEVATAEPGCIVLDLNMPGMDGLTVLRTLRARGDGRAVIVISGQADVARAVAAMKCGAADVIEKPFSEDVIIAAIRKAVCSATRAAMQADDVARVMALTPREHDVLAHMITGQSNKMIAIDLGISPRTVEIHRANLMDKLDCHSLAEVVRMGLRAGVEPPPAGAVRVGLARTR